MSAVVDSADALVRTLASFDPQLETGEACARIAEALARCEKAIVAGRARAAARAAECGAHRRRGFVDATDWLAQAAGTTRRQAKADMDAAAAVTGCGATLDAVVAGQVSLAQAAEIAATEAVCPGTEQELLAVARRSNLSTVRDRGRDTRLAAADRSELHDRQRAARSGRHWRDGQGMVGAAVLLSPDAGVLFVNRWDAETDRVWRAAQRDGIAVTREQAAADAFVALVTGAAKPGTRGADAVVVVDLLALRRGHVHPGERCHLIGGGPLPVDVACELMDDAFIKAVVIDGVDITTVKHFGRHIPAELRTALQLGPLPALDGAVCAAQGCDRRYGLELDHLRPVVADGPTSLWNLEFKCGAHHRDKTRRERAAGLYDAAAWDDEPGSDRAPP